MPTYREPDGLAMSSRNSYLNSEERKSALCLKKSLDLAGEMVARGETSAANKESLQELILSHPFTVIDYVSLCDPVTLDDVETLKGETLLALAVRVGKTRLIDNGLLSEASESRKSHRERIKNMTVERKTDRRPETSCSLPSR